MPALKSRNARAVPRSQAERLWLAGGALLAALLLAMGYLLFIGPQQDDTTDLNDRADSARSQNSLLETRIASMRVQSKQLSRYQADLVAARKALPSSSGVPDFVRSLQSIGQSTLSTVSSLTVGPPTPVVANAAAGASATPVPSATSSTAPGQAAGIYSLAITAQVTGTPSALTKFLDQLQSVQPRAVLITQLSQSAAENGKAGAPNTLSLTMRAFVAPHGAGSASGPGGAAAPSTPNR